MASRASARRYARALFDVASKSGDVDATLAELKGSAPRSPATPICSAR